MKSSLNDLGATESKTAISSHAGKGNGHLASERPIRLTGFASHCKLIGAGGVERLKFGMVSLS